MRFRSTEGQGIYVRRYVPDRARAAQAQAEFQMGHLSPLPALRTSSPAEKQTQGRLSERILRTRMTLKKGRFIQLEPADTYKVLFPDFRPSPTPKKWLGEFDFRRHGKQLGATAVWSTAQCYTPEPYLDSSGVVSRLRDRSKEIAGEFRTSSPLDLWEKTILPQESLRKGVAESHLSRLTPKSDISKASTCVQSVKIYKKSVEQYLRCKSP